MVTHIHSYIYVATYTRLVRWNHTSNVSSTVCSADTDEEPTLPNTCTTAGSAAVCARTHVALTYLVLLRQA